MEHMLLSHPGKEIDVMTESEFFHAADEAIVTSCDRLESHLFRESAASVHHTSDISASSTVPVTRLGRILSIKHLFLTAGCNYHWSCSMAESSDCGLTGLRQCSDE
jgi:hypothetical protein